MKTENEKYCYECGEIINIKAEICPKCGCRQPEIFNMTSGCYSNKTLNARWLTTLLLSVFLGFLGIHRFFTGKIGTGLLMLLTAGGCGIWYIIDIIMIATENYSDDDNNKILMYQ